MIRRIISATVVCTLLFVFAERSKAEDLRAGIAVVDITPPLGYRMSGYFSERLSTGIKDPLQAKAVVFQQGAEQAALVFCDVVGISLSVSRTARQEASRRTGIPVPHIAIAATHSHTGPLYFGALRKHFHDKAVAQHGTDPHEQTDYPAELVAKLAAVIHQAQQAAVPVRLAAGYAEETRLSFNRRFHMKNGSVRFNPGQLNPNIVRAAGPIDPEVGLIKLTRASDARVLGALVSFALHLDTVGGTEYSADYPKYLQDELQTVYGDDFVSLFGAGTCGDINHVDVTTRGRRSAREIGTLLAETVKPRLAALEASAEPTLAVRSARVEAPLQRYRDADVAEARKKMDLVSSRQIPFLERVEAYKIVALQLREGPTLSLEVQVFRLSPDVAVVTLPGEVFVELGMAIKQASPFETTLVVELTNDAPGYIPTRQAFVEGSYETVNSRVESGSGEALVKTAVRLLKELNPTAE